jgi:hypothetical protein
VRRFARHFPVRPGGFDLLRNPFARAASASALVVVPAAAHGAIDAQLSQRRYRACLLAMTALLLASLATECFGARFDALLGTFELRNDDGSLIELIRIERQQQKYVLYRSRRGQWQPPVEIAAISKPALEAMINQRMDVEFEGLGNGELAVVKVPKGWKVGSFTCYSGYWLATVAGPAELQKVESGSR